jgi:CRP-like cAMP-binding protein
MQTVAVAKPTGNLLLDSVPESDFLRIHKALKYVNLREGETLSTQGEQVHYVYFPTTALISCRGNGSDGETVEIYSVGHEGLAEPASILTGIAAVTVEVQIAGEAYRITIDELCTAIRETKDLPEVLLKYAYSLAVRMVQATKCAMFHTVKQRLVLWLLMASRSHGPTIPSTHRAIAEALGARRASVTVEIEDLAAKGIIGRRRGRITILNHSELEAASCECYKLIKAGQEPDIKCYPLTYRPERAAS